MDNPLVCLLIKLWVLLLMISRAMETDTWPLRDTRMHHSDVIAENDFVKLLAEKYKDNGEETASTRSIVTGSSGLRTFDSHSRSANENVRDDSKLQVVRLVTSGSKIVFLEDEYDENDAAMVSAADVEIQRKKQKQNSTQQVDQQSPSLRQQQWQRRNLTDEMKVVAVSTSSSTKRSGREHSLADSSNTHNLQKQGKLELDQRKRIQLSQNNVLPTKSLLNTTPIPRTKIPLPAIVSSPIEFINLSHKSVLLVEEAEPLTISQNTTLSMSASANDSVDSASTNIRHVVAGNLARDGTADGPQSAASATTYYSSTQNSTRTNHPSSSSGARDAESKGDKPFAAASPMQEKLLPFQTVIYHDTKDGHGPQSRSISYSSISQNVDNLQAWQKSGILAEAQRNVNESLKPLLRSQTSEPSQFYSSPAKIHSMPSKFYSEPSKIYSEPAKVYAEPEQVYSEPAKIYGEPSKIYSEPSKVYSQPAKVYGEPAKTYWPRPPFAATTGALTSSSSSTSTTHRPAIVSRIAFGETQITHFSTDASPSNRLHPKHSQQQSHSNMSTHPRRFLFNLDKLPYDLLNAPEQSAKHDLETAWNTRHRSATEIRNFSAGRQYPCLESSSSLLMSPVPQYQHSSLFDQHSNQNTKGLLGRDLVKCVSHSSGIYSAREEHREYTTESSHVEEHYTPTPVQYYEGDSVVTNGRIHGSPGSVNFITTIPALSRSKQVGGREVSGETSAAHQDALYNFKANANADDAADADEATEENYGDDRSNKNRGDSKNLDDPEDDSGSKNNNSRNGKDESKIAYVVEGRNYRKYRVEEKTDEGFIVGEYGVVDHNDGNLRGVRYTADSTINRSLIQKALLTFLKLK